MERYTITPAPRSEYELDEIRDVLKQVPEGGVFLDIGANVGQYARWMAKQADLVYAFEPHPLIFGILQMTTDDLPNIEVFNLAVSQIDGYTDLWMSSVMQNHTTHRPFAENEKVKDKFSCVIQCASISLDTFSATHDLSDLRFVKIDVEGGEGDVLAGAVSLLRLTSPDLLVEFHQTADLELVKQVTTSCGYQLIRKLKCSSNYFLRKKER